MKILKDGTKVDADTYYFLLAWNDKDNKSYIMKRFNKTSLADLTITEYKILWLQATTLTYNEIVKK